MSITDPTSIPVPDDSAALSTDLTPTPGEPALAPTEGGLPVAAKTNRYHAPHSKSFGTLIRPYGRGKGLSIAAPRSNRPGQGLIPGSLHRVLPRDHLGSHLGVNRGSFKTPHASSDVVGGGRRG